MWVAMQRLFSLKYFYQISSRVLPWLGLICSALLVYGLIAGLAFVPPDYQQGDSFRIIYIHVPSAILSLSIYLIMSVMALITLVWRIKLAEIFFIVSGPIGASFTLLALITGALWGQPAWGTWWLWDARLTSELILLFLYLGAISLRSAIPSREKGVKASGILVLVGSVDLPIIHYSVNWWNTLHQKATLLQWRAPTIATEMLWPLLAMIVAFFLFYIIVLLLSARSEILQREQETKWVKELRMS